MSLPKLYLKNFVHLNGAHLYPEMVRILNVARATAPLLTDGAVWVTAANDGMHMATSLHYKNRAFDIRIKNIDGDEIDGAQTWVERMKLALGDDYDVILERDHIHCELDPKETP